MARGLGQTQDLPHDGNGLFEQHLGKIQHRGLLCPGAVEQQAAAAVPAGAEGRVGVVHQVRRGGHGAASEEQIRHQGAEGRFEAGGSAAGALAQRDSV